jgi:hypothetical protein
MGCSFDECGKRIFARGLCSKHYTRWRNHGDPSVVKKSVDGDPLRWLLATAAVQTDECLKWPFGRYASGYGIIQYEGRTTGTHRVVCRIVHGEPKGRQQAAHLCGDRLCCNPRHLHWASQSENELDKRLHGRAPIGSKNPRAKLTEADIPHIRLLVTTESHKRVGRMFGVSRKAISHAVNGKTWRHA